MGSNWVKQYITDPDVIPTMGSESKFDPLFGFPNGRKERVMVATDEQMVAAKLALVQRDYCAHKALDFYVCCMKVWPFASQCAHEKHEYRDCGYADWKLRMMEFEREKRLLLRAKRVPIENAGWKQIAVE